MFAELGSSKNDISKKQSKKIAIIEIPIKKIPLAIRPKKYKWIGTVKVNFFHQTPTTGVTSNR